MLTKTRRWSHPRGNAVVPYRWQATSNFPRSVNYLFRLSSALRSKLPGPMARDGVYDRCKNWMTKDAKQHPTKKFQKSS